MELTPEHSKRTMKDGLHQDVIDAYDYVDSRIPTADLSGPPMWFGWALREAFLAGISHAYRSSK
jgi:hypothetical protein